MRTDEVIRASEFCTHHEIELSFIYSLKDSGLIEVTSEDEEVFIPLNQLPQLEKMVRLYEMDINLEGIETISYLLERLQKQQDEIRRLVNRLRQYETDETEFDDYPA